MTIRRIIIGCSLLLLVTGCSVRKQSPLISPAHNAATASFHPDLQTLQAEKVVMLKVYGPHYNHFEYNPIIVKDKKVIDPIVKSLQQTQPSASGAVDQADTLLIYTYDNPQPMMFDFNAITGHNFGPRFKEAIKAIPVSKNGKL